jgi:hypothetical protein
LADAVIPILNNCSKYTAKTQELLNVTVAEAKLLVFSKYGTSVPVNTPFMGESVNILH